MAAALHLSFWGSIFAYKKPLNCTKFSSKRSKRREHAAKVQQVGTKRYSIAVENENNKIIGTYGAPPCLFDKRKQNVDDWSLIFLLLTGGEIYTEKLV